VRAFWAAQSGGFAGALAAILLFRIPKSPAGGVSFIGIMAVTVVLGFLPGIMFAIPSAFLGWRIQRATGCNVRSRIARGFLGAVFLLALVLAGSCAAFVFFINRR
jgi:hypothetical protein